MTGRRRWTTRILAAVFCLAIAGYLAILAGYQWSRRSTLERLARGGTVQATDLGPVEFARLGAGPPVVVLPGSFGGYDQALRLGRPLADRGLAVIAVSRPGYLGTPLATGRAPADQAAAVTTLLDSLGVPRAAILGISGGGPAALELAAAAPGRVVALVLIAALSGPKVQPPTPPAAPGWRDRVFGEDFSAWWQLRQYQRSGTAVLEAPIFSLDTKARLAASPELLAEYLELAWYRYPTKLRWDGYLNDREQFGRFAFDAFERIVAPTLVIHGTADRNAPIEHGDRAASRIAGARYLKIEGGDHYIGIARANEVWHSVTAFLTAPVAQAADSVRAP